MEGQQTAVEMTLDTIDTRLRALKEELAKLEAARAALVRGRPSRAVGEKGSPTSRRRRRTRRAPRVDRTTRSDQILELVGSHPGITIRELAEHMGIEPNYLYRVMPTLAEQGKVIRSGRSWHPGRGEKGRGSKTRKTMLAEALGSARLEDAEPGPKMRAVLEQWADGDVGTDELEAIAERAAAGEPLRAAASVKAR